MKAMDTAHSVRFVVHPCSLSFSSCLSPICSPLCLLSLCVLLCVTTLFRDCSIGLFSPMWLVLSVSVIGRCFSLGVVKSGVGLGAGVWG